MNRVDLVKTNFPDHFEAALAIEDPSGSKHKYLLWIAKQLSSGHNAPDINQTIKFFHENPDKFEVKDIYKYKDLKDVEDLVKEFGMSNRQSKLQDKQGSEKIYEDDNLTVVRIDDKPAMVLYGANTRWCTTMKDQTYYEDYVAQGNDFYIVIRKVEKALGSSKYAVVRKGLLDFQVYDAKDNYARSFSEEEADKLRDALKAIISDKPPKNYIRLVVNSQVPAEDAVEWLKAQTKVTREYIENKRPDLKYVSRTADELIGIFTNQWNLKYMCKIDAAKRSEMAQKLCSMTDKDKTSVKLALIHLLKESDKLLFAKDKNPTVRTKVVEGLKGSKAKEFLSDQSLVVFKMAARKVDVQLLLDWAAKSKSTKKKKAINEVIVERISQEKVREFILNQPKEVIKDLMV